jgi:hypothetical protein
LVLSSTSYLSPLLSDFLRTYGRVTRSMERRTKPICQNQEGTSEKYSLCGLYSINNALQIRDFLNVDHMSKVLDTLTDKLPDQDHGHKKYGAYTILAFQHALRTSTNKYQLRYLNQLPTFRGGNRGLYRKVAKSTFKSMIIIGICHSTI